MLYTKHFKSILLALLLFHSIETYSQNYEMLNKMGDAVVDSYVDVDCPDGFKWQMKFKNGYKGANNSKGKTIIPPIYKYIEYNNGTFTVKDRTGYVGKFTKDGKLIFPPYKYMAVFEINNVKDAPFIVYDDLYGLMNRKGEILLPEHYNLIRQCGDDKTGNFLLLKKDGYVGISDLKGNILIKPDNYNNIELEVAEDGVPYFYCVKYGEGSAVYNTSGEQIVSTPYASVKVKGKDNDRYLEISDGNGLGKMSMDGKVLIPVENKKVVNVTAAYNREGKSFIIYRDKKNKYFVKYLSKDTIIRPEYDNIDFIKNTGFKLYKDNSVGFADFKGNILVSPDKKYIDVLPLKKYIAAYDENGRQAIYSYAGKELYPAVNKRITWHQLQNYKENKLDTLIGFKDAQKCWGIKKLNGEILVQPEWDDFTFIESKSGIYFIVFRDGKIGLLDYNGNMILDPIYKNIADIDKDQGKFFLISTGYQGIADLNGNIVIVPETFNQISYDSAKKQFKGISGKRECVMNLSGKIISDNANHVASLEYLDKADAEFDKGNYKKAADLYGKALEYEQTASLYFNRGVSYYNWGKYYEAISDFNKVLESNPSNTLIDRTLDLIDKAQYYQEAKNERNNEIFQAIFGLAMTGVNYALQVKNRRNNPGISSVSKSPTSYSDNSESGNDNNVSTTANSKNKCGFCGGKGSIVEYASNFGINNGDWCEECDKKVNSGHYHKKCTHCNGSGLR